MVAHELWHIVQYQAWGAPLWEQTWIVEGTAEYVEALYRGDACLAPAALTVADMVTWPQPDAESLGQHYDTAGKFWRAFFEAYAAKTGKDEAGVLDKLIEGASRLGRIDPLGDRFWGVDLGAVRDRVHNGADCA